MSTLRNWYPEADLILKNGKIYTVALTIDEIKQGKTSFPILENGAVAVKNGKIIGVSESQNVDEFKGKNTKVVDLEGNVVIPGLMDSHMHATFTGINLLNLDLRGTKSLDELLDKLKTRAATTKKGQWIQGQCWNELDWDDKRLPTREDLDKVAPDHPVFLMRLCYHVAVVNSKALELAEITQNTVDPEGGRIGHFENGEPDGLLYENAAMGLVQSVIPPLTTDQLVNAQEAVGKEFNKSGVTSVIDANLGFDHMRAYQETYKRGKLRYRAGMMYYLDTATGSVSQHLRRLDEGVCITGFGDSMLKLNGIKITLDGVPGAKTACMRKPYKEDPSTCGFTTVPEEDLIQMVTKSHKYGWQVGIHTIGDKAADVALAGFTEADKISPAQERRHYLIHHPFPAPDQLEPMKKLNVGVAVQPTIMHLLGESAILHEEMAHQNVPCKTYFDNGIIAGGSSDAPVVPFDPFLGMWAAVTRLDSNGALWGPRERVTPTQALIMWTKNSAFFSHEDDIKGSIQVGNLADMVVVDRDFVTGPVDEIRDTKVLMTILDGKIVYQS